MDLINKTRFPAEIFYTVVGEDWQLASVVLRATFRIEGQTLTPDDDPVWPLDGQVFKTEFGDFDADSPFAREGTDLFVLGRAYPAQDPGRTGDVEIQVGSQLRYAIRVFGDRSWVRRGKQLEASEPEPFDSIPLTWEHAYGGAWPVPDMPGEMPWHANPRGRGFYMDAESAEDQPLPNLEDPDHLIRAWNDQPEPMATGPCPQEFSIRALNSAEFDMDATPPKLKRIKATYFNNANPRLILSPRPASGESLRISGVRPAGGSLSFTLPAQAFHTYVQLADRRYVFPAVLDTIAVLAEEERVVLGYRCTFRYRIVPLEHRAAVLYDGAAPAEPPHDYTIDWAAEEAKAGNEEAQAGSKAGNHA